MDGQIYTGQESLKDDQKSGQSVSKGTKIAQQTIEQTIATDGRYTVSHLCNITGVSLGTVLKILKK